MSEENKSESIAQKTRDAEQRRFEDLPPAAQRALKEAEARRQQIDERTRSRPREINGRGGLDPVRYDDWEIKGLTVDF